MYICMYIALLLPNDMYVLCTYVRVPETCWRQRYLKCDEKLSLQGIYPEDYPQLGRFVEESPALASDLAGNAFSGSICVAIGVALLSVAPRRCSCTYVCTCVSQIVYIHEPRVERRVACARTVICTYVKKGVGACVDRFATALPCRMLHT